MFVWMFQNVDLSAKGEKIMARRVSNCFRKCEMESRPIKLNFVAALALYLTKKRVYNTGEWN